MGVEDDARRHRAPSAMYDGQQAAPVSGAGVRGRAVLGALMGAQERRARGASPTGRGVCSDGGPTIGATTRSKWW